MKGIWLLFFIGMCVLPFTAQALSFCPDNIVNVNVTNIQSQIQWMTQQQSQSQEQHQEQHIEAASGTQGSWITSGSGSTGTGQDGYGIKQESQTYSRLVYPGEVVLFPVNGSGTCTLLSGLPVGFYAIPSGNGYYEFTVGSREAIPVYDPIYHHMDFGIVPVHDKVDYWTMKAKLDVSPDAAFCIVDNRAPMNGYTTIEVVVKS